jgi:hypothetical protein
MNRAGNTWLCLAMAAVCAAAWLTGCAGPRAAAPLEPGRIDSKIASLQGRLKGLGPATDPDEARRVAHAAVIDSYRLAEDYRLATPARWHNLLIQVGLRERGLCFHWTEDLMKRLQALNLRTYRLHWGVAHRGSDLYEHNSVVITASNQAFEDGLVLDPWRNSGDLYWATVREDGYPWVPLPPDQW